MPYYKRKEKCKNDSGESGTFVTIKKEDGKRQCWKSEAAFKRAVAARHAQGVAETMSFTEERLFEIILEEIALIESFLKPHRGKTVPVDDKVIKAIVAATSKKPLNEEVLTEDVKERIRNLVDRLGGGSDAIKRVAKRLAIPVALVASIAAGAGAGAYLAGVDSAAAQDDIELTATDDAGGDKFRLGDLAGSAFAGEEFSGMSNAEKVKKAWESYDLSQNGLEPAPVVSPIWIYKFAMVPADKIQHDDVLPLFGTTAAEYYNYWKNKVEANPMVELPLLKDMVYGDTGKWSGGTGDPNQNFKVAEDGSQILPPDWTVIYTVYADLMEDKLLDMLDYHNENAEDREELYQALGVKDMEGFNKFVEDTMFKIGRPL